jgi:hypothetical protein
MTKSDRSARVSSVFWLGLVAGALAACGDQNLFESLADDDTASAKIESAKIANDNGDFTQAIAILQGLCGTSTTAPACDAETASLLASAYAGRAGLNVFDLIENSVDTVTGTTTSSLSIFSVLLPSPTVDDKSDLHDAVEILASLSTPTANQNLQMAIYAMADAVVTVGVDLTNGFNSTTGRPNSVPLNPQAIDDVNTTSGTLGQVSNDLDLAIQGLDGSGLGNEDIRSDIEDLRRRLDPDLNNDVLSTEMHGFLANP